MAEIPLGKREGQHLEFKGRGALADLSGVGRAVVAMLNAEGGEIWIGVREDNGIAVEVEPLTDLELQRQRLRDYLIDAVEPAPGPQEIQIEAEPSEDRPTILRIAVRPHRDGRPYALLRKDGRLFSVRVGDRLRTMTRGELEQALGRERADDAESRLEEALAGEVADLQKTADPRLWLALAPVERLEVDLQTVKTATYLRHAEETGSRRVGRTLGSFVAHPQASGPRLGNKGLAAEVADLFRLEVRRGGCLRVTLSTRALVGPLGDEPNCLDGLALAEFLYSCFRVAGRIVADVEAPPAAASVLGHLALLGIRSVKLRPGCVWTSRCHDYAFSHPHPYPDDDLVLERPLRFTLHEIGEEPDACAFRMVRRIYEAFGFGEEALPPELDRRTKRLVLRE